jgi:hypothetical protein
MELVPVPGFGFFTLNVSKTIEDAFQVKSNLLFNAFIYICQGYLYAANLTGVEVPPDIRDKIKVNKC